MRARFPDVPLDEGFDVVPVPREPPPRYGSLKGSRIPACCDSFRQGRPQPFRRSRFESAAEQDFQEPRQLSSQLALRKRMQAQDLHAAGEGF
jgi:hypothetical protein